MQLVLPSISQLVHHLCDFNGEFDGIDYMGRHIEIEFLSNATTYDAGQTYVQMPLAIEEIQIQRDEWEILPPSV